MSLWPRVLGSMIMSRCRYLSRGNRASELGLFMAACSGAVKRPGAIESRTVHSTVVSDVYGQSVPNTIRAGSAISLTLSKDDLPAANAISYQNLRSLSWTLLSHTGGTRGIASRHARNGSTPP